MNNCEIYKADSIKIMSEMWIFNGNYRPYTSTIEIITKFGCKVLLHPSFNHRPGMPSVFHPASSFERHSLKTTFHGQ
jgi:hypothetical protein